jgi:hypothetical protein
LDLPLKGHDGSGHGLIQPLREGEEGSRHSIEVALHLLEVSAYTILGVHRALVLVSEAREAALTDL